MPLCDLPIASARQDGLERAGTGLLCVLLKHSASMKAASFNRKGTARGHKEVAVAPGCSVMPAASIPFSEGHDPLSRFIEGARRCF